MRLHSLLIAILILCWHTAPSSASGARQDQREEVARRYGLDPTSPLDSRVRDTSPKILKLFEEDGSTIHPTQHDLTVDERRKLSRAFDALPPLHRRILTERLRSVSFLDGMPNTALTSTVNPDEPYRLFDITIRAAILKQTASEWLTEKEQSCFDMTGTSLTVSIEAGKREALLYVLLHEATHIVDACLNITPPLKSGDQTDFTKGIWTDRTLPVTQYRDPLLMRVRFYSEKKLPVAQAKQLYDSLRQTPFASLYGSTSWSDDLAEYVTIYHWTEKLKQPYRIVIRDEGRAVLTYEPMKSSLSRGRIAQMKRFYQN